MDPEKQKLKTIAQRAHGVLRTLKMGDAGTIACDKQCTMEDFKEYIVAYSYHKAKWFTVTQDSVSNILICKRVTPPPWNHPEPDQEHEEP